MENASQDRPENTTENPKSWVAWKRRAEIAEAKGILNTMQRWRDADHEEYLALTRSEVIALIEGIRLFEAETLGEERAAALGRVVEQSCRAENRERRFRLALESIASSTCCSCCREAALVASSALRC